MNPTPFFVTLPVSNRGRIRRARIAHMRPAVVPCRAVWIEEATYARRVRLAYDTHACLHTCARGPRNFP